MQRRRCSYASIDGSSELGSWANSTIKNNASLAAQRIAPAEVLTKRLFDQMRIARAAEYRLPVELKGADTADAQTWEDGVLKSRLFRVERRFGV
jgi:hypothetical protein